MVCTSVVTSTADVIAIHVNFTNKYQAAPTQSATCVTWYKMYGCPAASEES